MLNKDDFPLMLRSAVAEVEATAGHNIWYCSFCRKRFGSHDPACAWGHLIHVLDEHVAELTKDSA